MNKATAVITCDRPGCGESFTGRIWFETARAARALGWKVAGHDGDGDWCPAHGQ